MTTKTPMNRPTNMKQRGTLTLSERLMRYLEKHANVWINGGDLEKLCAGAGYKGSTGSRELRTLAEHGKIQREERTNRTTSVRSVWYRWAGTESPQMTNQARLDFFDSLECQCQAPKVCVKHR